MIECANLRDGQCMAVYSLCGMSSETNPTTCEACSKAANPQSENAVTCGLAILAIGKAGMSVAQFPKVNSLLRRQIEEGPGTELKKLIAWFYSPDKKKCKCMNRIAKMNKWGPDKCEQKMETILRWLRHSAAIARVPYFRPAVILLVKKAIKNARLQSQQLPGKTAPLPIVSLQSKPVDGTQ